MKKKVIKTKLFLPGIEARNPPPRIASSFTFGKTYLIPLIPVKKIKNNNDITLKLIVIV